MHGQLALMCSFQKCASANVECPFWNALACLVAYMLVCRQLPYPFANEQTCTFTFQVDILILGSGPTGLGAATRLNQLGHDDWLIIDQVRLYVQMNTLSLSLCVRVASPYSTCAQACPASQPEHIMSSARLLCVPGAMSPA